MDPRTIAVAAIVAVVAAAGAIVYVFSKIDLERRVRIARLLGKAFIFLVGGTLLLGMVVQFMR